VASGKGNIMKRVLIANRGEIAIRVIRACKDHGIESVAVYSDEDRHSLHAQSADFAYSLHGVTAKETYLSISKIIAIAHESGADAVHPGYGFLSENADFAQAVIDAGLIWIGPPPAAISALGDKVSAVEAEQLGMVYKVISAESFLEEVTKIAETLAEMPTKAIGLTKRLLNQSITNNLENQLALESDLQIEASSSNDYKEGVTAFVEKRKPQFNGN
jgi:acetyl/propionyl-CoA carboxylase alpha subunit